MGERRKDIRSIGRALTLPSGVIFTVKQLRNEQLSQRLKLGDKWHSTSRLFTTWDGHQMHGATPFTWLTKTCEQYGLPKVNLHSFRHLNASLLISSGVDVKTVQSVLGHSQASTTIDIYAAAFQDREAQALGAVANILTGKSRRKAEKKKEQAKACSISFTYFIFFDHNDQTMTQTQNPHKTKNSQTLVNKGFASSLTWCGKRDLNPYVKDTRPSNVPVCQFQHCRITILFAELFCFVRIPCHSA